MLGTDNTPIVVFTYNRLETLQQLILSLNNCEEAKESELYIFSDGPKSPADNMLIIKVREYIKTITGFKQVTTFNSEVNKGLAKSIIGGVTTMFERYNSLIVLEDDLQVSKNFLRYMNESLCYYENEKRVFSISGYNIPMSESLNYKYDTYLTFRASSWGWASWKDRWQIIDWEVKDFKQFRKNPEKIRAFNRAGSDMFGMLERQQEGKIDSWAIRWCFHQYKNNYYSVYPMVSKIKNGGFNEMASNSHSYNRYDSMLDDGLQTHFKFPPHLEENKELLTLFSSFYSIRSRITGRIKTFLYLRGWLKNN